jgi:nucleoside-diphosphate-sugar epimerase
MSVDALGNFTGKRLAVFGAGYVGSLLVKAAVRSGAEVIALTRNPVKAQALEDVGAQVVVADLASNEWHRKIGAVDYAVNCVSSGGGGAEAYLHSYVHGTESIVRWLSETGPADALVYTSSTSVYPQSGCVVNESMPTEEAVGTARVLLAAEDVVKVVAETKACRRAVVLRLAGIYGPGRHHILDQLRSTVSPLPGRGDHRLNLIYRDDSVAAIGRAVSGF